MPPRSLTAAVATAMTLAFPAPPVRAEPSLGGTGAGLSLRAHQLNQAMIATRQAARRGEAPPRLAPLPAGLFATGAATSGQVAEGAPAPYGQWTTVAGGDLRFGRGALAGIAVSVGQGAADVAGGRLVRDGVAVTPFGTLNARHWYLDAIGSLSRDTLRLDRAGEPGSQATGWTASGAVEVGLRLSVGLFSLGPFAGLRWARSLVGALEDGAGRASAGERTGTAGLQIRADLRRPDAAIVPRVRFAVEQPLEGPAVNSRSLPRDERPYAVASDTAPGRVYRVRAELDLRAPRPGALVIATETAHPIGPRSATVISLNARFRF